MKYARCFSDAERQRTGLLDLAGQSDLDILSDRHGIVTPNWIGKSVVNSVVEFLRK